jgi:mRNA interferase MazF
VKRGEIRWYTFRLPDKRRPVLILTRSELVDRLGELIVVPATRTVRGISSTPGRFPRASGPRSVRRSTTGRACGRCSSPSSTGSRRS